MSNLSAGFVQAENAVSILRGSSRTFELTVTDEAGEAVDLTGATIYFTVKSDVLDTHPLIQKISSDPLQIEMPNPREGVALIHVSPSDTQGLEAREHVFDVWVILVSGKRYPVVLPSVFRIDAAVTVFV